MTPRLSSISGTRASSIAASVEAAVYNGDLPAGSRLPTVRALAVDLSVSTATVAEAYRLLRERGLVEGSGRAGTRVRPREPYLGRRSMPPTPPGARNLADGNPDPRLLPDLKAALASVTGRQRLYGSAANLEDLVTLVRDEFDADGFAGERVAVVASALEGIERVLLAHARVGDRVAIEDPGYCGLIDLLLMTGLRIVPVAIDEAGMVPDVLAKALSGGVTAVVLTTRNQNPTGAALNPSRAGALRAVLAEHPDVLVVEDDHSALISDVEPVSVASDRRRWAVVRSVSKALGPDLRVGFVYGDRFTITRVESRQQSGTGWVSHILQELVHGLLTDPSVRSQMKSAAATYAERRRALSDELSAAGFPVSARSGFNVWIPLPTETTVVQTMVVQGMLGHGWVVRTGDAFRISSSPGIRVTAATLTPRESRQFVGDLVGVLSSSGRTGSG